MEDLLCYVAVEFPDDPNVVGWCYWYICDDYGVKVGDKVVAPLGRHNNVQTGVIRHMSLCDEEHTPYPLHLTKRVRRVIKGE
ncbi:MAG: hypothetical protein J1G07_03170 [Clostridiales bacterium]|nr:hypothetical protein [Clostridiales bacterium]